MKKILSFILAAMMLVTCMSFVASAATTATYDIDVVYDIATQTATAHVYVTGGVAAVGHAGVKYDAAKFEYDSKAAAFSGVTVYDDATGLETSGNVLFAWAAAGGTKIDATADRVEIATLTFVLKAPLAGAVDAAETLAAASNLFSLATATGVTGWTNAYEAMGDDAIIVTPVAATVDFEIRQDLTGDVTFIASTNTDTTAGIKVTWPDNDFGSDVDYKVVITDTADTTDVITVIIDSNGNLVSYNGDTDVADFASRFELTSGTYSAKFNAASDPITKGKTYDVTVTPVATTTGYEGISVSDTLTPDEKGGGGGGGLGGGMPPVAPAVPNCTVNFVATPGSFGINQRTSFEIARGKSIQSLPTVVAPEGMKFAGWSLDGKTVIDVTKYEVQDNTEFKAVYTPIDDTHVKFIGGYNDGTVKPEGNLTRAEAAAIIARCSADFDENMTYVANFSDVKTDSWYYNYVAFVSEKGIVTGYTEGDFRPGNNITRAEFTAMMQRFLELAPVETDYFADVVAGYWAYGSIGACKAAGLVDGYNGYFNPANQITRAEAMKILNRATGRTPNAEKIDANATVTFTDLLKTKWYYYEVIEAATTHTVSSLH